MKKRVLSISESVAAKQDMQFGPNEFKKVALNEAAGIETVKRLENQIIEILNQQIVNEHESSQIYRAMSCWLDDAGWNDASKYFFKSADEELNHMRKIYNYLFSKNCVAEVRTIPAPDSKFGDIRDVISKSLEHEIQVTANWTKIAELAKQLGDDTTYEFSQWFLKEQVEEEEKFRDILDKMNLNMPEWKIEELFSE
jgi:ferritin